MPILLSCGAADPFAPPPVQEFLYRNVGSTDQTLMSSGRRQGVSVDAGHHDAVVGLNSRDLMKVKERFLEALLTSVQITAQRAILRDPPARGHGGCRIGFALTDSLVTTLN